MDRPISVNYPFSVVSAEHAVDAMMIKYLNSADVLIV